MGNKLNEEDYRNENREGKGIEYDENGNKKYEGDYKNGIVKEKE